MNDASVGQTKDTFDNDDENGNSKKAADNSIHADKDTVEADNGFEIETEHAKPKTENPVRFLEFPDSFKDCSELQIHDAYENNFNLYIEKKTISCLQDLYLQDNVLAPC